MLKIEHNVETGEIIKSEMTAEEIAEIKANKKTLEAIMAEAAAKEASRLAVLEKLGLTADEAAALLG